MNEALGHFTHAVKKLELLVLLQVAGVLLAVMVGFLHVLGFEESADGLVPFVLGEQVPNGERVLLRIFLEGLLYSARHVDGLELAGAVFYLPVGTVLDLPVWTVLDLTITEVPLQDLPLTQCLV